MESWNSPDYGRMSPSQENIAHLQPMKRDGESLEDFEDITKEEPSVKDMTAQFLEYETGNRGSNTSDGFVSRSDNDFPMDQKSSDLQKYDSDELAQRMEMNFEDSNLNEPLETYPNYLNYGEDSRNDFVNSEQTEFVPSFGASEDPGQPILNILDENKLIDLGNTDEISTGSDDLLYVPKQGESSPLLHEVEKDIAKRPPPECRSSETIDLTFNSQPLSKFTSEPGVDRKQEPEKLLGDGLHVKQNIEADLSENDDDFVPEPIPKDYPVISATEGKHLLAAIGLDTWFCPDLLHPKVESLIYWRDPKKSGIVFGAVLIILLSLTSFSLISVVAYTSLFALIGALAFRIYKSVMQAVQKTSEGHPFKKYLVAVLEHPIITAVFNNIEEYLDIDLTVNPDKAREISDVVVSHVNGALTEFRRLFLIEDVIDSIKFGVLLWSLTYIGAWFNGLSLLIIAFVGLFTLPKVYENNKTQIDANIDVVRAKINEVTEKITAVIPLGKKTEETKNKSE